MNKKECIIKSVYARRDVDWSIMSIGVWVTDPNSKSEYVYRFDYSLASFQKVFNKNENNMNTIIWSKVYLNETLTLN